MIIRNETDFAVLCQKLVTNDPAIRVVGLTLSTDGVRLQLNDAQSKLLASSLANNAIVTELHLNVEQLSVRGAACLCWIPVLSQQLNPGSTADDMQTTVTGRAAQFQKQLKLHSDVTPRTVEVAEQVIMRRSLLLIRERETGWVILITILQVKM